MSEKGLHEVHLETGTAANFDQSWRGEKWGAQSLTTTAEDSAHDEKSMSIWQAVRANPAAIAWSLVISTCVIMEGYDTNLLGNFWAYPTFQEKYGTFVGKSSESATGYQLSAAWQSGLGQASGVGAFFGALANGWLVAAFGPRRVVIGALLLLTALLFIVFFAQNKPTLLVGEILCGLPWGVFATSAPAYASEVLPLQLRVYFTSYTNMCFIIGQLISGGVLRGLVSRTDQWGYRIPFALQWFWPVVLTPLVYLAPESPWYLVRQNKLDAAERSIRRLQRRSAGQDPRKTLATIVYTNNLEEQLSVGTTYWDCFKGFELRRTEIACAVFAGQLVCGLCFAYASTYFFSSVGLNPEQTYSLGVGANGLAFLGCLCNWFLLMPYFGRRTIYVWGMFAMAVELLLIGILNPWTSQKHVAWAQAILTLVWTFTFQLSAGQLGWALPAEVGSTRLRQKTVVLARNSYYLASVSLGTLENYFMNPTAWNLQGYTGFIWGGCATIVFIWAYFRLPETKDRTFHELDILFAKGVPARKFKTTNVDAFDAVEADRLAVRYSVNGQNPRRPSFVPSISGRLAAHGGDKATEAQRRMSIEAAEHGGSRRPSIAPAVTEYLQTHDAK